MLNLVSLFFELMILQVVVSLSDVDRACINTYFADRNNDFLIGTWYEIYKFSKVLNLPPSAVCVKDVITKPSEADVQRYVDAYRLENPFSFNDNPVLLDRAEGKFQGMLLGHKEAKFHIFDPKSVFFREDYYEAWVYEKINENFVLYQKCFMRGNTKWILSRSNSTTDEELDEVIKSIEPKVRGYQTQRFCSP